MFLFRIVKQLMCRRQEALAVVHWLDPAIPASKIKEPKLFAPVVDNSRWRIRRLLSQYPGQGGDGSRDDRSGSCNQGDENGSVHITSRFPTVCSECRARSCPLTNRSRTLSPGSAGTARCPCI